MKSLGVICALVLWTSAVYARHKPEPWLAIVKSQDGFLFQGHVERTAFAFDIIGDQIQVAEQEDPGDPARMVIDGVFFTVMRVQKSDFAAADPDVLVAYRKSEQQYEKEQFGRVELSELDLCKGASLKHESWGLKALDIAAPTQAYMAVDAGNYVIVVSSAFANDEEEARMLGKFSSFCRSFKLGETK
jgi:acetaldehyde dehydrogenase (acetylating)